MKTSKFKIQRYSISVAAILLLSNLYVDARDLAGKWYSKTGDWVITIYKSGSEYSAAIPTTSTILSGERANHALTDFDAKGDHVKFQIHTAMPGFSFTSWAKYNLMLSPDGARLVGTVTGTSLNGRPIHKAETLFLRNQ